MTPPIHVGLAQHTYKKEGRGRSLSQNVVACFVEFVVVGVGVG